METKMSPKGSVEDDDIKDTLVVNRVAKKVSFSPENEVFEFTRSLKKQRKTVKSRKQGPSQDLQQELRRSNRIAVAGSNGKSKIGIAETEKVCSSSDISGSITQEACKVIKVIDLDEVEVKVISRRSTRLALGSKNFETLLPAKRFKRPVGIDVQTDTQEDRTRSLRLRANTSKGGGKSDGRPEHKYRENKDVELLSESNMSTNLERPLLSGNSGLDGTRKIKDKTAATSEESFGYTSSERNQLLGNTEPHIVGKQEQKEVEFNDESAFFTRLLGESGHDRLGNDKSGSRQYQSHHASSPKVDLKDDGVVRESHDAALDFKENIIGGSIIASKVSNSHEFNAGEETAGAEFTPKGSQAANVVGLDAIHVTSKQSRGNAPRVESVNLSEFDI